MVNGQEVIPEGSSVLGSVTVSEPSGNVKGRARLAFRFDQLDIDNETYDIRTQAVVHQAAGTKAEDAKKIGIGAAAGAVIGGLVGGKKGAAVGSAAGGGAGTAMVLTTAGEEVQLRSGTEIQVDLAEPLIMQVLKG